jgi:hypothetical protein
LQVQARSPAEKALTKTIEQATNVFRAGSGLSETLIDQGEFASQLLTIMVLAQAAATEEYCFF